MGKKSKAEGTIEIDEVREFFNDHPEIELYHMDSVLLSKMITQALDQMIQDKDGNPPHFTISNNFIFMEIEDLRFTIEIRNNSSYS